MMQPYDLPLEELWNYKPKPTRQDDFESFWEGTLIELSFVPMAYTLTPYDYPIKGVRVYRIRFTGFNHAKIEGWFAIPDLPGPHPGFVFFHGYNWAYEGNLHETVIWATRGYAAMHMFVRGQQGGSEDNVLSPHGHPTGWMCKGVQSPETYYYRAVYMDAVRAVDIISSIEGVDESRIGVYGWSQGGALAMVAASFSKRPTVVVADYPYLSNFRRAIDFAPTGPYLEFNDYFRRNASPHIEEQAMRTLSYFDMMNVAPLIHCHTRITIGMIDDITPPSTVFAAYNHLTCSKEIEVYRYFGHETMPIDVEAKLRVLKKHLQD